MTTHEQVLQWVANIVFSSSPKLTKSIQTTLKTTALGLGGLEVALSGSMHSDQKFKLLRDKLLLQANYIKVLNTFVKVHTITCEILPSNIFCSSVESIESTSFPWLGPTWAVPSDKGLSDFDSSTYFGILEIEEGEGCKLCIKMEEMFKTRNITRK